LLGEGGIACVEIGLGQAAAVIALFAACRLRVEQRQDLGGRTRCLVLSR
jgi:methylase of polypeptide subunit release factors